MENDDCFADIGEGERGRGWIRSFVGGMEKGCDKRLWNKERGDEQTAVLKSPNKAERGTRKQEFNMRNGDRTKLYTRRTTTTTRPLCAPSFCFVKHMLMPEEQESERERRRMCLRHGRGKRRISTHPHTQ